MPSFSKEGYMHYRNLDAYYYMASKGNKEAYYELYKEFRKRANSLIRITLNQMSNYTEIPVDFSDFIDTQFFRAINEYEVEKGNFTYYVDYILKLRIPSKIKSIVVEYANLYAQVEAKSADTRVIELMADPNQQSLQSEVARDRFKASITSPLKNMSNVDRLRNRIMLLQYAEYSNKEICEQLHLTVGELRGHLEKIKKDKRVVKLKLEMK